MGAKLDALFADLAQLTQAEDLKAAGIGKHGPGPGNEAVQPTQPAHQLVTRAKVQVIGIGEDDLRVQLFEQMLRDCLDRPGGADRHERRSLHLPMRPRQGPPPRLPTYGFYLKSERHIGDSIFSTGKTACAASALQ